MRSVGREGLMLAAAGTLQVRSVGREGLTLVAVGTLQVRSVEREGLTPAVAGTLQVRLGLTAIYALQSLCQFYIDLLIRLPASFHTFMWGRCFL